MAAGCSDPAAWPGSFFYPLATFEVLPVDPISVSPPAGGPFTPIVVTGNGCVGPGRALRVSLRSASEPPHGLPRAVLIGRLDTDGAWAAAGVLPPRFPSDPLTVEARCEVTTSRAYDDTLVYPLATFELLGGTVATIEATGPVRREPVGAVLGSESLPDPNAMTYPRPPVPAETTEFDLTVVFTPPPSGSGVVAVCENQWTCTPGDLTVPVRFGPFTG